MSWHARKHRVAHRAFLYGLADAQINRAPGAPYHLLNLVDRLRGKGLEFEAAWASVDVLLREWDPAAYPTPLLRELLDAARAARRHLVAVHDAERLYFALETYARYLNDRDRWPAAADVLETASRHCSTERSDSVGIALGLTYLRWGQVRRAAALGRALCRDDSVPVRLAGQFVTAHVLTADSCWKESERMFARVARAARRHRLAHLASRADVGRARALRGGGLPVEAALIAWHSSGDERRLIEVSACLEELSLWTPARRLAGWSAVGGADPADRWRALAATVRLSASLNDHVGCKRWARFGRALGKLGLPGLLGPAAFKAELARARAGFAKGDAPPREAPVPRRLRAIVAAVEAMGEAPASVTG